MISRPSTLLSSERENAPRRAAYLRIGGNVKIKMLLFALCVAFAGCKLKGERGEQGLQGDPGPGAIRIFSGTITSNDFTVAIPVPPTEIAQITSYIIDDSNVWIELPYFLNSIPVNVYSLWQPLTATGGSMRFANCQTGGGTKWQVVVILK